MKGPNFKVGRVRAVNDTGPSGTLTLSHPSAMLMKTPGSDDESFRMCRRCNRCFMMMGRSLSVLEFILGFIRVSKAAV